MAFLRKHRDRYWLVHNFRDNGQVRQVRLHAFHLATELAPQIDRAQAAVTASYGNRIAPTWVASVQQQLQQLQEAGQQRQREQQRQQVTQRLHDFLQSFDHWDGSAEERRCLLEDGLRHLRERLTQTPADLPERQTLAIGDGFWLMDKALYHQCQPAPDGPAMQDLAPVAWVSLINGRDLWLACQTCHARWLDLLSLTRLQPLNVYRRRISKFERFCQEHQVGDSCSILRGYRSGHVERLQGHLARIDAGSKRVEVQITHNNLSRTYWRQVQHVYFGLLEVRLTPEQHAQVTAASPDAAQSLGHNWYAVSDTPQMRLLLREFGVKY